MITSPYTLISGHFFSASRGSTANSLVDGSRDPFQTPLTPCREGRDPRLTLSNFTADAFRLNPPHLLDQRLTPSLANG